ncbi:hypothetical protein LA345_37360 (plasmid) [Burkholderia vietnamiensis]|uniref:Uncharacterized protein n=1 Tax=Burkholderia vietnamiensis (strain G4 / LMG 22486) TaxID=269482 RepID=A4JVJ4_BURVG|nr:hypothetical protein Bcep1808_7420 [Burkholderia vietnamiensis G4]MCB4349485.1 hypothetical protein [Burkholderia vietnamiensis]
MQPSERHAIADQLVASLAEASPEYGPNVLGSLIASRIVTLIAAADALVQSTSHPILLAEIIPGVDVIGVRDYTRPPREDADAVSLESIWEQGDSGFEWMAALGNVAVRYLTSRAAGATGPGAISHSGADGIYYFAFKAEYRGIALAQIGLTQDEVRIVDTGAPVGA